MTSRIPPLLEPYLALPPETSLIVLTSVLGASANWLVLRHLHALLAPLPPPPQPSRNLDGGREDSDVKVQVKVLLVSFLRDLAFWADGAARLGLDLPGLARRGRFAFVDGLGGLFLRHDGEGGTGTTTPGSAPGAGVALARSTGVADLRKTLHDAVDALRGGGDGDGDGRIRVVLVVDQLDFLLAAAGEEEGGKGTGGGGGSYLLELREMVLDLREKVHATILTLSADEPLIATQTTALEKQHASFVLSMAHEAEMVLSLRLLDTGVAKDVSGVVRITRGGQSCLRTVEEKEYLYHVSGDGSVRVFERGQ